MCLGPGPQTKCTATGDSVSSRSGLSMVKFAACGVADEAKGRRWIESGACDSGRKTDLQIYEHKSEVFGSFYLPGD